MPLPPSLCLTKSTRYDGDSCRQNIKPRVSFVDLALNWNNPHSGHHPFHKGVGFHVNTSWHASRVVPGDEKHHNKGSKLQVWNLKTLSHLGEDGVDGHLLLEETAREVHLGSHVAAVHLDLADVRLLLPQLHKADLRQQEYQNEDRMVTNNPRGAEKTQKDLAPKRSWYALPRRQ